MLLFFSFWCYIWFSISPDTTPAAQGILITGGFIAVFGSLMALANLLLDRLGRSRGLFSAVTAAIIVLSGEPGLFPHLLKVDVQFEYAELKIILRMFFYVYTKGILH